MEGPDLRKGEPVEQGTVAEDLVVAVNIPSHDMVHATFAGDLARMLAYTSTHFSPEGGIKAILVNQVSATVISTARNELARGALEQGADYMLWLDADMRFPRDTLVRLLVHGVPIVGVNYASRDPRNMDFVAVKRFASGDDPGERLVTGPDSTGLEEAEGIGFGVVLVHRSVFERLPDPDGPDGPWFQFGWDPEIQRTIGEDSWFCRRAREAGHTVWVDHDLSKEVRHTGAMEFAPDHVQARYEFLKEVTDGADR